jgi:hypothetical protein
MQSEQPPHERRSSLRLDMEKELITLTWLDQGNEISRKAICLDVSSGGLKVSIDRHIATDHVVDITFKSKNGQSNSIKAKVLRCIEQAHGWYDIGFMFVELGDE